jgi:hypothetical protein
MGREMDAVKALGPREYCPCKSGKRLEGCCLVGNLLRPPIADVNPRGERTRYTNPGCYLSSVDDNCCTTLSLEHFLSKGILEVLHIVGGSRGVLLDGFPWQTEPRVLYPNVAAPSRILCARHNTGLSGLDKCALDFFRCLMDVPAHLRDPKGKRDKLVMFSGPNLERWTIKLLTGLLVSGNAGLDGQKIVSKVPAGWLEVLMGRKHLPPSIGLGSMMVPGGEPEKLPTRIQFRPIFYNDSDLIDEPVGAEIWIRNLALGLVLAHIPDRSGTWAANFQPHANVIRYSGPSSSVTILLAGPGWDESTGVEIAWLPDA